MMDHPNIAKVLDAGLTPVGQPFFVMELVNGLPLNKFCDEARLTTKDRLELFVTICQAVQHAHQKGIVHRDLKPANILITIIDGKPVPKVIDFGVAKATAGKLTDESLSTQFGAIVGTLEYMRPEQAGFSGEDIDTRADIYLLGVILYELLTGLRPIDAKRLKKAALTEMIRIIREEEPSKPSTRLSTDEALPSMAALRQVEPRKLMALLRGELDWVVMKCLEKHRERRYETANGLARDIQRYLADEAVEARPPSAGYRMGKFLRRNRGPALAAALVLLAVLGGLTAVLAVQSLAHARLKKSNNETHLALIETQKAQKATAAALEQSEESLKQAEAVSRFLITTFRKPDPSVQGKDVKVAQILDQALATLDRGYAGSQATRGALLEALGRSYEGLGLYPKSEEAFRKAREVRKAALGPDHRATLQSATGQAVALWKLDRRAEALAMVQDTLARQEKALGPDDRDTQNSRSDLANFLTFNGRVKEAIPILERLLKTEETKFGPGNHNIAAARGNLAAAYQAAGRVDEAIPLFESALKQRESYFGHDHPETLLTRMNLAGAYRDAGRLGEAIPLLVATLKVREAKLGDDHPDTLTVRNNLANAYQDAGRLDEAIPLLEATLRRSEAKNGPDDSGTLISRNSLAVAYLSAGHPDRAIPLLEATLKVSEAKLGVGHPNTLIPRNNPASAYLAAGRFGEAIALHEESARLLESKPGPDHPLTLTVRHNLALAYQNAGRLAEATPIFEETLRRQERRRGPDHPDTLTTRANLAHAYRDAGRLVEATSIFEATLKQFQAKFGPDHPSVLITLNGLASAYQDAGRWADAETLLRDIVVRRRKREKPDSLLLTGDLSNLARNLIKQGRGPEAEPLMRECLAIRVRVMPNDWRRYNAASLLARR